MIDVIGDDGFPGFDDRIGQGSGDESDGHESAKHDAAGGWTFAQPEESAPDAVVEQAVQFGKPHTADADAIKTEMGCAQVSHATGLFGIDLKCGANFDLFVAGNEWVVVSEDVVKKLEIDSVGVRECALLKRKVAQLRVRFCECGREKQGVHGIFDMVVLKPGEAFEREHVVPVVCHGVLCHLDARPRTDRIIHRDVSVHGALP